MRITEVNEPFLLTVREQTGHEDNSEIDTKDLAKHVTRSLIYTLRMTGIASKRALYNKVLERVKVCKMKQLIGEIK